MRLIAFETRMKASSVILFEDLLAVTDIGTRMADTVNSEWYMYISKVLCECVFLYLSLIHGVVAYMYNWSRVSLRGP